MKTDIQIAQEADMKPIVEIAEAAGIRPEELELYGNYKAKVNLSIWDRVSGNPDGKLILVTAINPTPAGEGKTTTTIGLAQALAKMGKRTMLALREPSLGPCMGVKGGAAGGGYSQVVPMEDINLHFTGDIHAVTTAHNLVAAVIDNVIHRKNELNIDPRRIVWRRVMDMNDRALRNIVVGLGGLTNGVPREDGFDISVASEIMAILCLATDLMDLKERIKRAVVAYTYDRKPVTIGDLGISGAVTLLLKDAIKPNLVQTLENVPAFVHGGPFANIAHGCNSVVATRLGLKLADYFVTEAGFGADLGAEKFFNIKCRQAGLVPDAVVIVTTVRALKLHGGADRKELDVEDLEALRRGIPNLEKHIENVSKFNLPAVVAINRFPTDTEAELAEIKEACARLGTCAALSEVYSRGGEGGLELAEEVLSAIESEHEQFKFLYDENEPIKDKIEKIAREIYGADGVIYSRQAERDINTYNSQGFDKLPICMAKTQYSLSDDKNLLGRPEGFSITVREVRLSAGAGFLVPITGEIMTMPGLPKNPAACGIDILEDGTIVGLF